MFHVSISQGFLQFSVLFFSFFLERGPRSTNLLTCRHHLSGPSDKARLSTKDESLGRDLDYKTRDSLTYIPLWYHQAQCGGTSSHYPASLRFTTMATDNSTTELSALDKKNEDGVTPSFSFTPSSGHGEPVVTRWELWSYYCKRRKISRRLCGF
jgi:hypothetical protein